jgi:hypothetical protein
VAKRRFRFRARLGADHPYQELIRRTLEAATVKRPGVQARLILDALRYAALEGEPWSHEAIDAILLVGISADCSAAWRYMDGMAVVRFKGDEYEVPRNVGVRGRSASGVPERWVQRGFFVDLSREDALSVLEREYSDQGTHNLRIAAFEHYLAIWDKHPQAQSAREACILEGIDPFSILGDDQQAI